MDPPSGAAADPASALSEADAFFLQLLEQDHLSTGSNELAEGWMQTEPFFDPNVPEIGLQSSASSPSYSTHQFDSLETYQDDFQSPSSTSPSGSIDQDASALNNTAPNGIYNHIIPTPIVIDDEEGGNESSEKPAGPPARKKRAIDSISSSKPIFQSIYAPPPQQHTAPPATKHVLKDRARRQDLNEGIERLRKYLVFDLGARPTKAEIVHKAADHIEFVQNSLNQANDYIRQTWNRSQQTSPHSHPGSNSTSASSTPVLMILVFLFGFFLPKSIFQGISSPSTMRSLDFLPLDSLSLPSPLAVAIFCVLSSYFLYVWYLFAIPYVKYGSAKHLRVQSYLTSCSNPSTRRVERRKLSMQAKKLLERDLPTSKVSIYLLICLESVRFISNRLIVGRVLERLVLLVRGVRSDLIRDHLVIQAAWYNSNNSWTRKQILLESLRTVNEIEFVSTLADSDSVSVVSPLYYAIGHMLMHRLGWFSPLSKWCIHRARATKSASRHPDAEESAGTVNHTLEYDPAHMEGIDALLQAAMCGKITESRQLCDTAIAQLVLSPGTVSYQHILKCAKEYSFYFFERNKASLDELVRLYRSASTSNTPDEALLLNLLLILMSTMWEKGIKGGKRIVALLNLLQKRFEPELLSSDPVLVASISLARCSAELSFSHTISALSLLEDVVDQLESIYMDPKAISLVPDAVRLSLRLLKVSKTQSESYFRCEEAAHRGIHILELQSKHIRTAEPLVLFFKGKLRSVLGNRDSARENLFSCIQICKSAKDIAWDPLQHRCLALCEKLKVEISDPSPLALHQRRAGSTEK